MKGWLGLKMPASSSKRLSVDDAQGLALLLENGFTYRQAEEILRSKKNAVVFDEIAKELEASKDMSEVLCHHMPISYEYCMQDLMDFLPFAETLGVASKIIRQEKAEKTFLMKGLVYPIGLLCGVSGGIFLFDRTVFPVMMDLLMGFQENGASLVMMKNVLEYGTTLLFSGVAVMMAGVLWALSPSRAADTYCRLAVKYPGCFLVQYASRRFAMFFKICLEKGAATKDTIEMMKVMRGRPLTTCIAKELEKSFLAGESFATAITSPYLDPSLAASFRLAMYTDNAICMLEGYLSMCDMRVERQMKIIVTCIRLVSYAAVGGVIVAVYKVLMLPMGMLQQL